VFHTHLPFLFGVVSVPGLLLLVQGPHVHHMRIGFLAQRYACVVLNVRGEGVVLGICTSFVTLESSMLCLSILDEQ
jgi:hypothetical protein